MGCVRILISTGYVTVEMVLRVVYQPVVTLPRDDGVIKYKKPKLLG